MIGQRIGPYAVLSKLGEGGMGEVYRAHDDVLRRDVAIKVVAERQLGDSDGRARFEREARALAMLNHPNISSIYGFVDSGGIRAIVMELVEGLTLKEIIEGSRPQAPGPSTIENTLSIARQLIDALEAAHDKGIVHRDLKPANIKVTRAGAVKVLDFGIAKALASATGDRSDETTIEATEQGTVVGTAAYMSPEQARGQVVDARADIWAFGAVLYELLTRRKAFPGGTATDVMAALLTKEPDWSAIPADVRPGVVRLLRRCLEKDPARRLRHIADARFEIEDPTMPVASNPAPASRRWRLTAIAAIALLGGAVLGVALRPLFVSGDARGDRPAGAITFGFSEPPGTKFNLFNDPIKVSPDGTRVALAPISPDGKSRLWIRSMSSAVPERLDGTEGATFPFWSPDGKSIGFFADGQVKVIDLSSRAVRAIAPWAPGGLGGGSWNADGVIVFAEVGPGLKRVRATGGDVKPATTLDTTGGRSSTSHPTSCRTTATTCTPRSLRRLRNPASRLARSTRRRRLTCRFQRSLSTLRPGIWCIHAEASFWRSNSISIG